MFTLPPEKKQSVFSEELTNIGFERFSNRDEIGRGGYSTVYKAHYESRDVVLKTMLKGASHNDKKIFAKEAKLLAEIDHPNIVRLVGVCDDPIMIVLEYLEFSFSPFGRQASFSNLDDLLCYLSEEKIYHLFLEIGNIIARDLVSAVEFLHSKNIVHRDIKPANVLISNQHYKEYVQSSTATPLIVCKLGDLGEARSRLVQTKGVIRNTKNQTNMVNRGSVAFQAPETLVEEFMLPKASIDDLKKADIWSLVMSLFIIVHPSVRHPFENNFQNDEVTEKHFRDLLRQRVLPKPPDDELHVLQYQKITKLIQNSLKYDPQLRPTALEIVKMMDEEIPVEETDTHLKNLPTFYNKDAENDVCHGDGKDLEVKKEQSNDLYNIEELPSFQPEVLVLSSDSEDEPIDDVNLDLELEYQRRAEKNSICEGTIQTTEKYTNPEEERNGADVQQQVESEAEEEMEFQVTQEDQVEDVEVRKKTKENNNSDNLIDRSTIEVDPSFPSFVQPLKRRTYDPLQVEVVTAKKKLASEPVHTSTPLQEKVTQQNDYISAIQYTTNELMQWNGYANEHFGVPSIYRYQAEAIKCFVEQKDLLCIVRTSGGKSLCFQLPAVLRPDQMVLVVAPIAALVREQVMKLQNLGVKAAMLGGNTNSRVTMMDDEISILYCNPECLFNQDGTETKNLNDIVERHNNGHKQVSLVVVDEAHKLFEWVSFRPSFDWLKIIQQKLPGTPCHLYSATMTKLMQQKAVTIELRDPIIIKTTTNRPNIYYRICDYQIPSITTMANGSKLENWDKVVEKIISMTKDGEALIYTSKSTTASAVTRSFLLKEKSASEYKGLANQSASDREQVQDEHLSGNIKYLVATSAYGLGIENPRQHTVFRIGLPMSICEWMQESGRGGRQGQNAMGTLLESTYNDLQKIIFWEKKMTWVQKKELLKDMSEVVRYSCLPLCGMCSRKFAMETFDDHTEPEHSHPLGCCDGCNIRKFCAQDIEEYENASVLNVISACCEIQETFVNDKKKDSARQLHANINKIIAYLKGKKGADIDPDFEPNSNAHSHYGVEKKGLSVNHLKIIVKQCIAKGWFKPDLYYHFFQTPSGIRQKINLGLLVTDAGKTVMQTKLTNVPHPAKVVEALLYVRKMEDVFVNPNQANFMFDDTVMKPCGTKSYKQVQPQVEKMLLRPFINIVSKDQYHYLGFHHDCALLLFAENVEKVVGYPGDENLDFLFDDLNLSKGQGNPPIEKSVMVAGVSGIKRTSVKFIKNACAGVKKCPECDFVCSRKAKSNPCPYHGSKQLTLVNTEDCPGVFVYIKPTDVTDNRRWLAFLNGPHNHPIPPPSKPTRLLEAKVKQAMKRDPTLKTSDLQCGYGMDCSPMSISLVAASADKMQYIRKKVSVNPTEVSVADSMIVNFDSYVKSEVDLADEKYLDSKTKLEILQATTPYHRELINEGAFSCAVFMTPLMQILFSEGEFFECDVTFPGLSTYKYLLNITTFNSSALRHDVVGRCLMTSASAKCYEATFKGLFEVVTKRFPAFENGAAVRGITMDFCQAQAKGMEAALGEGEGKIKGCRSVHFARQRDKVITKVCKTEEEKKLFKKICQQIQEESSQDFVLELYSVLDGSVRVIDLSYSGNFSEEEKSVNTHHWTQASSWVKWWSANRVLTMLCDAFSNMTPENWEMASNHTNHVEALNKISVADKKKISLKVQLKHMYTEDRKRAYAHIAARQGIVSEKRPKSKAYLPKVVSHDANLIGRFVMAKRPCKDSKKLLRKRNEFIQAVIKEYCEDRDVFKAFFINYPNEFVEVPSDISKTVHESVVLMPETNNQNITT